MIGFVFKMAIVAFVISMFVAFLIHMLYTIVTSTTMSKYYDQKVKDEYQRAKRIKKIRTERILNDIKALESMESSDIVDYYYGKRSITDEGDFLSNWKKNESNNK